MFLFYKARSLEQRIFCNHDNINRPIVLAEFLETSSWSWWGHKNTTRSFTSCWVSMLNAIFYGLVWNVRHLGKAWCAWCINSKFRLYVCVGLTLSLCPSSHMYAAFKQNSVILLLSFVGTAVLFPAWHAIFTIWLQLNQFSVYYIQQELLFWIWHIHVELLPVFCLFAICITLEFSTASVVCIVILGFVANFLPTCSMI